MDLRYEASGFKKQNAMEMSNCSGRIKSTMAVGFAAVPWRNQEVAVF